MPARKPLVWSEDGRPEELPSSDSLDASGTAELFNDRFVATGHQAFFRLSYPCVVKGTSVYLNGIKQRHQSQIHLSEKQVIFKHALFPGDVVEIEGQKELT